ncbi:precorrin-6y C5,15-methyltransferase (decarboxylating) subunit CbiE [Bacillota bacterium LX-D]|nr:precorrin-6y C5,15-methyltransferase (decarboxylating) subunit CbiE [Bacillota bacterium LX-D]
MLSVVGIGPGHKDYLLPKAVEVVNSAQVIIGGKRALELFPQHTGKKKEITGKLNEVVDFIRQNQNQHIAVLVSGDPGFHSLLTFLKKKFPKEEMQVIPGISSLQMAYAKLGMPWQDAILLSAHGRDLNELKNYFQLPELALLTDPVNNPAKIARFWLGNGGQDSISYICKNLSYENESINKTTLSSLLNSADTTPCVMVIKNE